MKLFSLTFFLPCAIFTITNGQAIDTLSYHPTEVTLHGTIECDTFPGPPNYKSIKDGDSAEVCWFLRLSAPVFMLGIPGDQITRSISNVTKIQFVLPPSYPNLDYMLIGHKVTVTGTLHPSFPGINRTPVLIMYHTIAAG